MLVKYNQCFDQHILLNKLNKNISNNFSKIKLYFYTLAQNVK